MRLTLFLWAGLSALVAAVPTPATCGTVSKGRDKHVDLLSDAKCHGLPDYGRGVKYTPGGCLCSFFATNDCSGNTIPNLKDGFIGRSATVRSYECAHGSHKPGVDVQVRDTSTNFPCEPSQAGQYTCALYGNNQVAVVVCTFNGRWEWVLGAFCGPRGCCIKALDGTAFCNSECAPASALGSTDAIITSIEPPVRETKSEASAAVDLQVRAASNFACEPSQAGWYTCADYDNGQVAVVVCTFNGRWEWVLGAFCGPQSGHCCKVDLTPPWKAFCQCDASAGLGSTEDIGLTGAIMTSIEPQVREAESEASAAVEARAAANSNLPCKSSEAGFYTCAFTDKQEAAIVVCTFRNNRWQWVTSAMCGPQSRNCCKLGTIPWTAFCQCGAAAEAAGEEPSDPFNIVSIEPPTTSTGPEVSTALTQSVEPPIKSIDSRAASQTPVFSCQPSKAGLHGCGETTTHQGAVTVCAWKDNQFQWVITALCGKGIDCCKLGPIPGTAYCMCGPSAGADTSEPLSIPGVSIASIGPLAENVDSDSANVTKRQSTDVANGKDTPTIEARASLDTNRWGDIRVYTGYDLSGRGFFANGMDKCANLPDYVSRKVKSLLQYKRAYCQYYNEQNCPRKNIIANYDSTKGDLKFGRLPDEHQNVASIRCTPFGPSSASASASETEKGQTREHPALQRRFAEPGSMMIWDNTNFRGQGVVFRAMQVCVNVMDGMARRGESLTQSPGAICRYYSNDNCNGGYLGNLNSKYGQLWAYTLQGWNNRIASVACWLPNQAPTFGNTEDEEPIDPTLEPPALQGHALERRDLPPGTVALWDDNDFSGKRVEFRPWQECTRVPDGMGRRAQSLTISKGAECRFWGNDRCGNWDYVGFLSAKWGETWSPNLRGWGNRINTVICDVPGLSWRDGSALNDAGAEERVDPTIEAPMIVEEGDEGEEIDAVEGTS